MSLSADWMGTNMVADLGVEHIAAAGLLLLLRISSALVTAPVFSSTAIPMRVKAGFVVALTILMVGPACAVAGAQVALTPSAMVGEVAVGICFGLTFAFLTESLLFAGSLMSVSFSFSLANLMDPNSRVETAVLSTMFNWIAILVLLGAGLHRTLLAAILRSISAVPLGHAPAALASGTALMGMASGMFFAAVQLAAPVLSAGLVVEVVIGMLSRLAPSLPTTAASVPLKTVVSYMVLIGSLALWPAWIESYFVHLLNAAQKVLQA